MAAVVAHTHNQSIFSLFAIITVVTLIVHDGTPITFTVLYYWSMSGFIQNVAPPREK